MKSIRRQQYYHNAKRGFRKDDSEGFLVPEYYPRPPAPCRGSSRAVPARGGRVFPVLSRAGLWYAYTHGNRPPKETALP